MQRLVKEKALYAASASDCAARSALKKKVVKDLEF